MRRALVLVLLWSTLSAVLGCASFREYRKESHAYRESKADRDQRRAWIDGNWQAGYGFNNPNPERSRQGLKPVNFDGSIDEEEGFFETAIENFLSDTINYGIKSSFAATGALWRRALKR